MKQDRSVKYSYAAGIIDGDGTICVNINKNRKPNPTYAISVDVSMIDGRIVDWLYGTFGGYIYLVNNDTHFPDGRIYKNHEQYHWCVRCKKADVFLRKIYPFLKLKKKQAELAIRLGQRIKVGKREKAKGFKRGRPLNSVHEMEIRKEIVEALKKQNHTFHKCLALETKRSGEREVSLSKTIVQQPEKKNLV